MKSVGTIKFYSIDDTGDLVKAGWKTNQIFKKTGPLGFVDIGKITATSGAAIGIQKEPDFWKKMPVDGPATREFSLEWDLTNAEFPVFKGSATPDVKK